MHRFMIFVSAALLTLSAAQASDEDNRHCFNGYAYSEDGNTLLYTEHHEQQMRDGRPVKWTVDYRSANERVMAAAPGEIIAEKEFDFSDNPTVPVYTLDLKREGYREGIRRDGSGWRMIRRESGNAETESEPFDYEPPMAADSGFDIFVKQNFAALEGGKTVAFDFVAAGNLSTVGLRAYKLGDVEFNGEPAVKFKAELSSLFRFIVDVSIEMIYDPDTKKLLQYQGVSNMHNAAGDTFPVVIKYLDSAPEGAEAAKTPQGCSDQ